MESSETAKTPKHRSPSYPSIGLEKALERAQRLWDVAGKHPALLESVMKAWGYSPKSSGGLLTVAALKKFGLAVDEGSGWGRKVSLTKAAQELLVYGADKDSDDWKLRVREVALRPAIYRELWDKYEGSLPDDSVIRPYLVLERGFSEVAAQDMLKGFRQTIAFSNVSDGFPVGSEEGEDSEVSNEGDSEPLDERPIAPEALKPESKGDSRERPQRTVQVTYSPTAWALVQAPFPLSEADWEAMMRVLEGMKPGLVQPDSDTSAA